ncbi:MAG: SDR family oxidoreductase [Acidobacteria bacterium]|nr:SDR family oxidoreductase [Acidobacteriota bacterium]
MPAPARPVEDHVELNGRAALITGGARMGEAIAATLADLGADVALVYRASAESAERAAAAVRARGRRAVTLRADLADPLDCHATVAEVAAALGRLDIVVNMASLYAAVPLDQLDAARWDLQMAVDLRAAFLVSMAAVPHLRAVGGGRIVNFSDWTAASGRPRYLGFVPYYVAKAGVKALTEALALELAADRILVNAVAPGPIVAPPGMSAEEHVAVERATPLGRWGGEAEIAKTVAFFCQSDFMTGETVRVDGGRHLK